MGKKQLVEQLNAKGFEVSMDDIYTSSDACIQYLKENKLNRPYFLVDDNVLKDFTDDFQRRQNEDAVVVGLPSTLFDYRLLSKGMKYVFVSPVHLESFYYFFKSSCSFVYGIETKCVKIIYESQNIF